MRQLHRGGGLVIISGSGSEGGVYTSSTSDNLSIGARGAHAGARSTVHLSLVRITY